jgi:hypothetical protein
MPPRERDRGGGGRERDRKRSAYWSMCFTCPSTGTNVPPLHSGGDEAPLLRLCELLRNS